MYKRYQISIPEGKGVFSTKYYYDEGVQHLKKVKDFLDKKLDEFERIGEHIDASSVMDKWFPNTSSHMFISHSNADETQVIMLCGWLKKELGIDSFVDSKLWGYSNELLKILDDKYSKNSLGVNYSYNKRNVSTSHVHVMLMSSLMKMIDKAECLIFVNTDSSVELGEAIKEEKTLSPWIYNELSVSNIMRVNTPQRRRGIKIATESAKSDSVELYAEDAAMTALYDIAGILKSIKKIPLDVLTAWGLNAKKTPEGSLDWLYNNCPSRSRHE